MNQMQAGLPNQVGTESSINVIGSLVLDTERGLKFKRGINEFARTGTIFPAAQYPSAARDGGTMVNGIPAVGQTSTNSSLCGIASNGAGTIVAVFGSASAYYTTNGGATWSSSGLSFSATDVVWHSGQSRFIVFGNTASAINCAWSATGTSGWSAGTPSVCAGANVDSAKAACDGTTCVVAVQSTTAAGCIATTTNGTALTARTSAVGGIGQMPYVAVLPSLGATRWVVAAGGSGSHQSSVADGSAWSACNTGGTAPSGIAAGNGMFLLLTTTAGVFFTSANGSTWVAGNLPVLPGNMDSMGFPTNIGTAQVNAVMFDGDRFVIGTAVATSSASQYQGVFAYTADGALWVARQLTRQAGSGTTNAFLSCQSFNGNLIVIPAGAGYAGADRSASYMTSANWFTSCDYVGKARPVFAPQGVSSSGSQSIYYVGIK